MAGKRRANREGSIWKKPDGRWGAALTLDTPIGPKRKTTTRKTRREADEWLTKMKADRNSGSFIEPSIIPVWKYAEDWLENSVRHSVKPVTLKFYSRLVKNHIVPALGHIPIKNLHPRQIQALYAEKALSGLSPATRRHIHTALKKMLSQAVLWGDLRSNPADHVSVPKGTAGRAADQVKPFSSEDVQNLWRTSRRTGDRFYALYVLAVNSGLREEELCGLQWGDLHLPPAPQRGAVMVRRAVVETEHSFGIDEVKTGMSRRRVEILSNAVRVLKEHRIRQTEERLAAKKWQDSDQVFTTTYGTLLNRYRLGHHFRRLRSRAGISTEHRIKDLRHTFATMMLERGVHPKIVQEMLGHESIRITMDTYSHWIKGIHGDHLGGFEDLFGDE